MAYSAEKIISKSPCVNIYHCCTHKSGSQWLMAIFKDPMVFAYSGLDHYRYVDELPEKIDRRKITDRYFEHPFPKYKIVSPLYVTYDSILKIPKSGHYKTIFILRDPRDLIVSDYFSLKYSHSPYPEIIEIRNILLSMNLDKGLIFCLNRRIDDGTFK